MPKKTSRQERGRDNRLSELLGSQALELLDGNGLNLIHQAGIDVVRQIILDILSGKNLRDSTEMLPRSRIAALNIALTGLFVKGATQFPDFVRNLPALSADILARKKVPKQPSGRRPARKRPAIKSRLEDVMLSGATHDMFQTVLRSM